MIPHPSSSQESRRLSVQRRMPTGARSCAPAPERLDDYCPLQPTDKQRKFLILKAREAFYGGAAGGGKSTALLMGALQHAYVPGYAALILRRDTQRLHLAGGLIPKSHEWLAGSGAKWNAGRCQWTFPTDGPPATITFGYLQSPLDKFRYGSSEYQYIAFDELTEFAEEDYLFLFSRLRRTSRFSAPLRVRSASNPGGPGHLWVKSRFIDDNSVSDAAGHAGSPAMPDGEAYSAGDLAYVPARVADNPHLDADEYRQSLMHLPPVTRERLLHGDWSIQAAGQFRAEWLRYYVALGDELQVLDPQGKAVVAAQARLCDRFCTIDPAGTPAEASQATGRPHSWSVIQIWYQPRGKLAHFLFLRHQWRAQVDFHDLLTAIRQVHDEWQPREIFVEKERLGTAICSMLVREGVPIVAIPPEGKEKDVRARPLIHKYSRGEVLLPKLDISWRPDFEAELLAWTGGKREPCDQIDAAAYAAIIAERSQPQEAVVLEGLSM
ncbi:MAG TPA: terminase family protein [Pirellulaceae bacterium]|nr:terminase family protein [Pirellulaceae bacterium]